MRLNRVRPTQLKWAAVTTKNTTSNLVVNVAIFCKVGEEERCIYEYSVLSTMERLPTPLLTWRNGDGDATKVFRNWSIGTTV